MTNLPKRVTNFLRMFYRIFLRGIWTIFGFMAHSLTRAFDDTNPERQKPTNQFSEAPPRELVSQPLWAERLTTSKRLSWKIQHDLAKPPHPLGGFARGPKSPHSLTRRRLPKSISEFLALREDKSHYHEWFQGSALFRPLNLPLATKTLSN